MASRRSSKRSSKSRKSTRGPKGARGPAGRPAGQTAVWLGALALAGVAAIGTGIYLTEHKSSGGSPTPLPPGPSGQTTANLVTGHRYSVTFVCPSSASTPTITGITGVSLVSTTPTTNGGIIVFDYTGASGSYPIAGAGCSVAILDQGVSPAAAMLAASGPFTPVANGAQLVAGATYLESVPPISGQTLAGLVSQFNSTGFFSVTQSFDVGSVPSGWPSTDSDPSRWRVVATYTGSGTDNLSIASNANVFQAASATPSV